MVISNESNKYRRCQKRISIGFKLRVTTRKKKKIIWNSLKGVMSYKVPPEVDTLVDPKVCNNLVNGMKSGSQVMLARIKLMRDNILRRDLNLG